MTRFCHYLKLYLSKEKREIQSVSGPRFELLSCRIRSTNITLYYNYTYQPVTIHQEAAATHETLAILIQQAVTEYSLFKSVNCSTYFGWYFTHHQELITLYLQYLALMRPLVLPVVTATNNGLINATYCRYRLLMMGEIPPETC